MATSFINLKGLKKRIAELRTELTHLLHLENYISGASPKKRGRPAKNPAVASAKVGKPAGRRRRSGKRGAMGEKILKFLGSKGKDGAHVSEIATHVGTKPANVTAWTYATGKKCVKRVKPATYAIKD